MKTKALCLTGILAALVCVRPAHAAVIMTLEQVGANVDATASGTVNTTGLSFNGSVQAVPHVTPTIGTLLAGAASAIDAYEPISGPTSFGPGGFTGVSTATGDLLGMDGTLAIIFVPHNYVSGAPLSSTATWNNTTLAALGVTTGTYTWTWGSGANADSLTLYLGVPAPTSVPEPAPALLLTLGAAGLALLKRIKK